jgi:hypothetical protein
VTAVASDRQLRKDIVDLVGGRPGWRLEPRTTPGASPLWCFVADGKVELSVTAERGALRLYVMATDQEFAFRDADELSAWLLRHRAEAFGEVPERPPGKDRVRRFFEWN